MKRMFVCLYFFTFSVFVRSDKIESRALYDIRSSTQPYKYISMDDSVILGSTVEAIISKKEALDYIIKIIELNLMGIQHYKLEISDKLICGSENDPHLVKSCNEGDPLIYWNINEVQDNFYEISLKDTKMCVTIQEYNSIKGGNKIGLEDCMSRKNQTFEFKILKHGPGYNKKAEKKLKKIKEGN